MKTLCRYLLHAGVLDIFSLFFRPNIQSCQTKIHQQMSIQRWRLFAGRVCIWHKDTNTHLKMLDKHVIIPTGKL